MTTIVADVAIGLAFVVALGSVVALVGSKRRERRWKADAVASQVKLLEARQKAECQ